MKASQSAETRPCMMRTGQLHGLVCVNSCADDAGSGEVSVERRRYLQRPGRRRHIGDCVVVAVAECRPRGSALSQAAAALQLLVERRRRQADSAGQSRCSRSRFPLCRWSGAARPGLHNVRSARSGGRATNVGGARIAGVSIRRGGDGRRSLLGESGGVAPERRAGLRGAERSSAGLFAASCSSRLRAAGGVSCRLLLRAPAVVHVAAVQRSESADVASARLPAPSPSKLADTAASPTGTSALRSSGVLPRRTVSRAAASPDAARYAVPSIQSVY